jgi:hypothetical protein
MLFIIQQAGRAFRGNSVDRQPLCMDIDTVSAFIGGRSRKGENRTLRQITSP